MLEKLPNLSEQLINGSRSGCLVGCDDLSIVWASPCPLPTKREELGHPWMRGKLKPCGKLGWGAQGRTAVASGVALFQKQPPRV